MKKLLLTLVLSLCFVGNSYASIDDPVVYYDDFDLDVACGLKAGEKESSENKDKGSKESQANFTKAKIISVTDGDTVTAKIGSKNFKLRMIGVDTPETVHPSKPVGFYGKEASDFTRANLLGKDVYLEKDISETDKYNRTLRYVWLTLPKNLANPSFEEVRDQMFNAILLRDGYGLLATFPPDVKYLDEFRKIAKFAEIQELGLYNQAARDKFEGKESSSKTGNNSSSKGRYVGDGDIPIVDQKIELVAGSNGSYLADVTQGPIKANMASGKYHSPGQQGYNKISINNVTWFSSAKAAEKAGYIAAKR